MRTAYEWTCDECGRDNFCRALPLPAEDVKRVLVAVGTLEPTAALPPRYADQFVSFPAEVTCGHCDSTYETEDER